MVRMRQPVGRYRLVMLRAGALGVLAWALLTACHPASAPLLLPSGELPTQLSEWNLLAVTRGQLQISAVALVYDLNTPLFSDYALKMRTVWVPDGASIKRSANADAEPGALEFPVGTVLTKTFYYFRPGMSRLGEPRSGAALSAAQPRNGHLDLAQVHLLETRVLVHQKAGWQAAAYVWDEDQQDAVIAPGGRLLQPEFEHPELHRRVRAEYLVPDRSQCANCHARNHTVKLLQPLGPRLDNLATRQVDKHRGHSGKLSRDAPQLARWRERGWLSATTDPAQPLTPLARWDDASAPLAARAIAYLDVNCGHCHNTTGAADTSGLYLDRRSLTTAPQGVCKAPVAAGKGAGDLAYDVVPGRAAESILLLRMQSDDPGVMMPELGRSLAHLQGVRLIRDWINSLAGGCPAPLSHRLHAA